MPQWSHLRDAVVSAKVVPVRDAKGCVELTELAAATPWSPPPLEMVDFSRPQSVRQSAQVSLAQFRGRFHDVRLVAGMAGIADIGNGEYICDGVYDNLERINAAWYEKHGLRVSDSGDCQFHCGRGEPLQVANAISFFGWENGNYAHWLSEKLGRFYWINQAVLPADTVLLVEAGLPASIMDSLAIFWPPERTIQVQPGQACDVAVLHYFSDTADIWEPRDGYVYQGDEYRICPGAIAWMATYVKSRCAAVDGDGKAYLIRPPGGNGRTIVNQQQLIRELQADGFQAFQPELRSFVEQVGSLSSCRLAVLGSGAAAANVLWMPQGATLVMLIQDNPQMWYWFFHALAAAVGVRLVYYPVKGLPGTHSVIFHWSVEVPVEGLRQWLSQESQRQSSAGGASIARPLDASSLYQELSQRRKGRAPMQIAPLATASDIDVTVAVMSYNNAQYLGETLDSILAQERVKLEVVVFDDCSKDDSLAVLQRYSAEPRLKFEVNPENLGMTGNYNKCVAAGSGRYLVVLGSDDILYPGHLSSLVAAMDAHPNAALGYTQCYWIDEQGQRLQYADHPGHRRQSYSGGRDEVIDLLSYDNYITPSAAMLRRSALPLVTLEEGGIHRHDMLAGDWELWIRLARVAPDFLFLRQPSVGYRIHGGQISKSFYGSDRPLREHTEILEMNLADASTRARMVAAAQSIWQLYQRRVEAFPPDIRAPLQTRIDAIRRALQEEGKEGVDECLFSIILTTYNRPDLLKDALASVGAQTLRDFEVILINDNGEPVEHLLAAYDFPISYIRQGRNRGLSAARNAGLKLACGRYVVYLDDDDIYLPNHLAVLAEAFERHPGSVIYTGVEYVNERLENGQRIELGRSRPFEHEEFDRDRLFVQNYIPVNTWAHPREMLAEVGEFDIGLAAFEDWDMLLRLATRYPFEHVPAVTSEVHTRAPGAGGDHMLGRERKNFPALYRELYQRYAGSASETLQSGRQEMLERLGVPVDKGDEAPDLNEWLAARLPTEVQSRLISERLEQAQGGLVLGVVVVDADGDQDALIATVRSLGNDRHLYASVKIVALTTLDAPATGWDEKLHYVRLDQRGLVEQVNDVVGSLQADWFMLVQAGSVFTQSGLMVAALDLLASPDCRAVYGDELLLQDNGKLGVALRPGLNLDMLLSLPGVMARHWLFNRPLWQQSGGFDLAAGQAFELDYILRLILDCGLEGMGHIGEPLLKSRAPLLTNSLDERDVIVRHLNARGYPQADVGATRPGHYEISYGHAQLAKVSILVSANGGLAKIRRCVESVLEKTSYPSYEVLILDHADQDQATANWLQGVEQLGTSAIKVVRLPQGLSLAQGRNMAVEQATGDYLLWLDCGVAVLSGDWLHALMNHGLRPEVGAVGAKLITGDSRVASGGIVLGLNGPAGHVGVGQPLDAAGYLQRLVIDQNHTALSGNCLLLRRTLFAELGGFDEAPEMAPWTDVDLCLRLHSAGYFNVWTPRSPLLITAEAPLAATAEQQDAMYARWLPLLARDPVYNPNFKLDADEEFALAPSLLSWNPLSSWKPLPRVLAHPADSFGCGHYRIINPLKVLNNEGVVDGTFAWGHLSLTELERFAPDSIVLQRQIDAEQIESMRRMQAFSSAFKVYELDDYLPNLPMKSVHREQMPKDILKSLRKGLGYVDRFVVSTEPLAEAFSELHGDIRVVENRLSVEWWKGLSSRRRRGSKPRVGWAGGISHTGDLELIADVVKELAGEVEWVFFGMCPEKIRPYVREMHIGVPIEAYPSKLASLDLDLALAPVEQNLFNECKSNLRLLEYGACGFPVVCSDVRCYQGDRLPVTRVKNRFKDWVDAIRMHLSDLDATARMGDQLRQAVYSDWMLEGDKLELWRRAWMPD